MSFARGAGPLALPLAATRSGKDLGSGWSDGPAERRTQENSEQAPIIAPNIGESFASAIAVSGATPGLLAPALTVMET